ncbi:hypothetical protein L1887_54377 [Cichorium endivia]|nr:hypothetical protein L1887_54377 [Cichorium endivia]
MARSALLEGKGGPQRGRRDDLVRNADQGAGRLEAESHEKASESSESRKRRQRTERPGGVRCASRSDGSGAPGTRRVCAERETFCADRGYVDESEGAESGRRWVRTDCVAKSPARARHAIEAATADRRNPGCHARKFQHSSVTALASPGANHAGGGKGAC